MPPANDSAHGVYYAADELGGCVIEVFGDTGVIETANYGVAEVLLPRDIVLLDLNAGGAWDAGSSSALTKDADRSYTQRWARYFYAESITYGLIDGLRYENAHNDAQAYVLFERSGTLDLERDRALADPGLETELFRVADRLHLIFA